MKEQRFTEEKKFEVVMEMLAGKMPHAEICRKYGISSTYAYKLKDRATEILKQGIGRPSGREAPEVERLKQKVTDLEQLAGDQALAIRALKKTMR